jgi:hypothetical protein
VTLSSTVDRHHDFRSGTPPSRVQTVERARNNLGATEFGDDRGTAIPVKSGAAGGVDGEADPATPPGPVASERKFLHDDIAFETRDPSKLLLKYRGLHGSTGGQGRVRIVTTS